MHFCETKTFSEFLIEAHFKHATPKKTELQQALKLLGRLLDRAEFNKHYRVEFEPEGFGDIT